MRRAVLFLLVVFSFSRLSAFTWVSVNIDQKTIEAMTEGYAEELAAELLNEQSISKILDHYTSAEVATAGIFASKWLDRQAMKNVGPFGSAQENYYYVRIWNMVKMRIMPKIWDVASLMIQYPERAIYWGPFLFKVCEDTRQLCMTFSSVVTNCRITFQDIVFYTISDDLKDLFDLTKLGTVDWKNLWEKLGDFGSGLTKEDLLEDLEGLMQAGSSIASAGGAVLNDAWMNASKAGNVFSMKPAEIIELYDEFKELYEVFNNPMLIKDMVMEKLLTTDSLGVARLLTPAGYNLTSYVSDYLQELQGRYYTQRWYIRPVASAASEIVYRYEPSSYSNSAKYRSDEYVRLLNWNLSQASSPEFLESVLVNSENHAYWSRAKVAQMNATNDGYTYSFSCSLFSSPYYKDSYGFFNGKKQIGMCYAYLITITRRSNAELPPVYEELFDSYTDSEEAMQARFDAKLRELKDLGDGMEYVIGKDEKHYYDVADETRVHDCAMVSFSMECHDKASLGEGSFGWKENGDQPNCFNERTKSYAFQSTLGNSQSTLERIYNELTGMQNEYDGYVSEESDIIARREALYPQTEYAHYGDSAFNAADYQAATAEYDALGNRLVSVRAKEAELEPKITEMSDIRDSAEEDYSDEIDGNYRIPAVMHQLESAYNVQWEDEGSWVTFECERGVFERVGHIPNIRGAVTFRAELTFQRKESHHWLIGRYHRAILNIHWTFGADYSTSSIVDYMEFDSGSSDADNAEIVNRRLRELKEEHPDCDIEANYAKSNPDATDGDDDAFHLLWVCDRLAVARDVDYRLSKIYAQLVLAEKFLRQKMLLEDVLRQALGLQGIGGGLHGKLGRKSFRRWFRAACSATTGQSVTDLMNQYPDEEEEE